MKFAFEIAFGIATELYSDDFLSISSEVSFILSPIVLYNF